MVKLISCISLMVLLIGCGANTTKPPIIDTQIVNVGVFQCPAAYKDIVIPPRPILAIHLLSYEQTNDPGQVAVAYRLTIEQLIQYSSQLEAVGGGYQAMCGAITPTVD